MNRNVNRRQFVQAGIVGAVGTGYFSYPISAQESKSPNEKLDLAIVGVANKGGHNVDQLTSENIVALCDVDSNFLGRASTRFPKAAKYQDYRKMLDAEAKNVDAVVVSTADHTHAPPTSIALDLGKHVYCEKPLTHTVQEARVVAELAKKNNLATQMGIQIHAQNNYRRVVELIQSQAIGKVKEVYCWCNKGWSDGRFKPWDQPVPSRINWDLWLGPAKKRPYSPGIHPADWRRFWEYGSGTFGDMACHVMDLPFWALNLTHPSSVKCEGPDLHPDGAPAWVKASYRFPETDAHGPLDFYWSDGGAHFDLVKQTVDHAGQPLSKWGLGILFVGEKGQLAADYGRRILLPRDDFAGFEPPEQTIDASIGHWKEWILACKTGSPTTCNFGYSGRLTESVLLGIVAYRTGKGILWDADSLSAKNSPDSEQFIKKEYRKGWNVVGIG